MTKSVKMPIKRNNPNADKVRNRSDTHIGDNVNSIFCGQHNDKGIKAVADVLERTAVVSLFAAIEPNGDKGQQRQRLPRQEECAFITSFQIISS